MTFKKYYKNTCVICGKTFKTPYFNKLTCSFDCKAELRRKNSREHNRRKRAKKINEPCEICGFYETVDIHHESRTETHYLCPNHHALITRGIKTFKELKERITI